MKEFDLEKALSGAPVRLRDGQKAIIYYRIPDHIRYHKDEPVMRPLKGAILSKYGDDLKMEEACSWKANGSYSHTQSPKDIVGLWKE